ncbi:MAG: type I methionyl aminopeptidase [Patescibacteria group bacterium]
MFTIKTKEEIKAIREGGKILADIMDKVSREIKPGAETGDLEDMVCRMMEEAGGRPAFKGFEVFRDGFFPTALITSINEEVVHGPAKPSRKLKPGDIVGIDCGMEYPIDVKRKNGELVYSVKKNNRTLPVNPYSRYGGYYTDMAKTLPVGNIDKKTKKLVKTARECLEKAIAQAKPGNKLSDIGKAVQAHAEAGGFSVVRELVGHGVGHDVHEDPQIFNFDFSGFTFEDQALEAGMVVALEPMVNIGGYKVRLAKDNFTFKTMDNSLSAHFEHTIAITKKGAEIMTIR